MLRLSLFRRRLELPAVLLCIGVLAVSGCRRGDSIAERPADAHSPLADSAVDNIRGPRYNVLLVSVDTTRADHLACYGHSLAKTPNIDRLAAEGTLFAQCIASAPLTLPSHSTMLTGSYPFVHGARDNGIFKLSGDNITLAEIFQDAGYATHGEVAGMVLNRQYGLDQGFDTFGDVEEAARKPQMRSVGDDALSDDPEIEQPRIVAETDRKADEITRRGIELLTAKAEANEPFFMFLHYFDPHWPHEAPDRFREAFEDGYLAEIAFFDEQFGKLMEAVRDLGLAQNTLVVFTADHGEGRGDHGEHTHSVFLYDSTLHVPLVVWCPGQIPAGQVVQTQVRLVDVASTIVDFVELDTTPQMQGTSLLPFVADPTRKSSLPCYSDTLVPQHNLNYSPLRSLRVDGWKYILAPRSELYNLVEDRGEVFNVAMNEPERAARMKEELRELIANSLEPVAGRGAVNTDHGDTRKLAALGYVSSAVNTDMASEDELDHFEPKGINPRDRIESIECWASGLGSFHAGNFELSEKLYRRFVELEPDLPVGASYLAKCLLMLDRKDEAIDWWRRNIELAPDQAEGHRVLGTLLVKRGELEEGVEHLREAIKCNPEEVAARVNLAIVLTTGGRLEPALKLLDEALEIEPEAARIHLQKGIALRRIGRTNEAIESLHEALRLESTLLRAHGQLAIAFHELGKTDQAIEQLERAIQSQPNQPLLHHRLAEIQTAVGNTEAAGRSFTRVAELLPESAIAERNLGANFLKLENYAAAIDHLRRAVELNPEAPRAIQYLANALETAGDADEAIQTYEKLIQARPRFGPAYIPVANLLMGQGNPSRAIELLRQGCEAMPKNPAIINALAWHLATMSQSELRDGPEAVILAERATEIVGTPGALLLDTLAAAYAEAGRFEDAVAVADRAIEAVGPAQDPGLADRIRARRGQYEQRLPYREP